MKVNYNGHNAKVTIMGTCQPAELVPKEWCMTQFYQMCADGDHKGRAYGKFGKRYCQHWYIERGKNLNKAKGS